MTTQKRIIGSLKRFLKMEFFDAATGVFLKKVRK
jgi:hypothetical protein